MNSSVVSPRTWRRRLISSLCLCALIAPATLAEASLYDDGKRNWQARRYPTAYPPLDGHRKLPKGRTVEVDYMLGTSACRISELRRRGTNILNAMLYSYQLTVAMRQRVTSERDLCRSAAQLTGAKDISAGRIVSAGASARGKIFYFDDSVSSYPAREVRPMAPEEFASRLIPIGEEARMAARLKSLAPVGARSLVVGRYAFATTAGQTDAQLRTIAATLDRYINFLSSEYGIAPPETYVTIYLQPSISKLKGAALQLHGLDVSYSTLGYAFADDQSTVAVVTGTGAGTLLHELFHLLVRQSFGDIPQWLDEGIAGLYEVSRREGDRQVGLPNWRGRVLAGSRGRQPSLAAVMSSPWFGFDMTPSGDTPNLFIDDEDAAIHLATARYFAFYLQEKKLLTPVFKALRDRDPGADEDPGAAVIALVVRTTGAASIDALQADYENWLRGVIS